MTTQQEQLLEERVKTLPPPIKELIHGGKLENAFKELHEKWGVHIDVADQIENETMLVLVGLESPKDFARNLIKNTELEPEDAGKIALDINEQIFKPIHNTLLRLSQAEDVTEDIEKIPVSPKNGPQEEAQGVTGAISEAPETSTPSQPTSRMEASSRTVRQEVSEGEEKKPEGDQYGVHDPYREPLKEE